MGLIDSHETAILDYYFGKSVSLTQPGAFYLGVSTSTPSGDGTGFTEPVDGAYVRLSTAPADWTSAVAGAPSYIQNLSLFEFPQATASWGSITFFGLFEVATAGVPIITGSVTPVETIQSADTLRFNAGALQINLGHSGEV